MQFGVTSVQSIILKTGHFIHNLVAINSSQDNIPYCILAVEVCNMDVNAAVSLGFM